VFVHVRTRSADDSREFGTTLPIGSTAEKQVYVKEGGRKREGFAHMLFRAIFWIGLVALLMPHEPDLGYGRPHATVSLPSGLANWLGGEMKAHPDFCDTHRGACSAGANILAGMQSLALRSLGQVKAEIEANERERVVGARAI